jgi:hypothetical protein
VSFQRKHRKYENNAPDEDSIHLGQREEEMPKDEPKQVRCLMRTQRVEHHRVY